MIERILKHMNIYREMKNAAIPLNLIGKKGGRFLYECGQTGKSAGTFQSDGGVK